MFGNFDKHRYTTLAHPEVLDFYRDILSADEIEALCAHHSFLESSSSSVSSYPAPNAETKGRKRARSLNDDQGTASESEEGEVRHYTKKRRD